MNTTEHNLLTKAMANYRAGAYDEKAFCSSLDTVITMLTELHLHDFRRKLENISAKLEMIDFSGIEGDKREQFPKEFEQLDLLVSAYPVNR